MPRLTKILEDTRRLPAAACEHLNQLVGDWRLISDISFSDLVLYVASGDSYIAAAQVRPTTAATLFETDVVGEAIEAEYEEYIEAVMVTQEILVTESEDSVDTWVPVSYQGKIIAVMRVVSAVVPDRVPSASHENYEDIAEILIEMVKAGDFPIDGTPSSYRPGSPHVSNGVIFLDADGLVVYASPNAVSNIHKYGVDQPILGENLAELVAENFDEAYIHDETLPVVLLGKAAWTVELESQDIVMTLRAVPLTRDGERVGALLLCRDVTRMRLNERELMSKDATIKEINHRVKNNLQTVSALLRMQARRASNSETRTALENAQRRVEMIAIVHEQLSKTVDERVDFDAVFGSLLRTIRDVAVTENAVDISVEGAFGWVKAEQATALAVVLNEIISNAIEHGLAQGGYVQIRASRDGKELELEIEDNGEGMHGHVPTPGVSSLSGRSEQSSGLGTQIVRTLVASDLEGKIVWEEVQPHGTLVRIKARMR